MVKSSTKLLRTLLRAGKAQQRTANQLVKSWFGPVPVQARPKARPKPKPAPAVKSGASRAQAVDPPAAPRVGGSAPAVLPGKWLASYYSAPAQLGSVPGRRMHYYLYLPHKVQPEEASLKGLPLIVMLHGCQQSATQFAQGTRMNRLAEQRGYAVLYPQQSLRSHPRRCWKWYEKTTQQGGGDVRMIVGAIEQVIARYAIDRSRIYIGGISAGAGMANIVALNHPELIAAVGMHSGPVFGAGHSMLGALGVMRHGASQYADGAIGEVLAGNPGFPLMPAILIQGQGDKVVRPINQAQLVRQSILLNRMPSDTSVTVDIKPPGAEGSRNPAYGHLIRDFYVGKKLLLRVAQIEQLEHAWSGGDASLAFNSKAGPDASKMMLDFFARHQRKL